MDDAFASLMSKFTVPPKTAASLSGVAVLVTSMPRSIVDDIMLKSVLLLFTRSLIVFLSPEFDADPVEAISTPSIVITLYLGSSPRITICVASPPDLMSETPGSLPIDSAAFASGRACMRAAETTFIIF